MREKNIYAKICLIKELLIKGVKPYIDTNSISCIASVQFPLQNIVAIASYMIYNSELHKNQLTQSTQ